MANPIYATISATGDTNFEIDSALAPFVLGVAVVVPAGVTATFAINVTLDPLSPQPWEPQSPVWIPTTITAATATTLLPVTTPCRGVQIAVASITGGDLAVKIVQPFFVGT